MGDDPTQPPDGSASLGLEVERGAVLIGFQDQGNLGMGYLASSLSQAELPVDLVEFRDRKSAVLERIRKADPVVVGFSLIFQFYLNDYRRLMRYLRRQGVDAHFTMGGHYPSLCVDEVLQAVPELDSVTLFEGEATLVDLVTRLRECADWKQVAGLAYRENDAVMETGERAPIEDLDQLPWPLRPYEPDLVLGWPTLPILASRGCARRCSFCSIHMFYRAAPGKTVRLRDPVRVAAEMEMLADTRGVRIFLFQDDDFPLWGRAGRRWVTELADEIEQRGLHRRCIWKISCRAEYIETDLFQRLRAAGLYLVYMGLESGSGQGLEVLNKKTTVETNHRAVDTLKDLDLLVEYGFMLFDPSSTFESVRQNIGFLRSILADGSGGAIFCRMLPYGGTPIREQLRAEGRLRGGVQDPDYLFLDPRLNRYHEVLNRAVAPWIQGAGLSHRINWAWHEVFVIERLVGTVPGIGRYREDLADLAVRSNEVLFDFVESTSEAFEAGHGGSVTDPQPRRSAHQFGDELLSLRNRFVAEHQDTLLDAVAQSQLADEPITTPRLD